VKPKWSQQFSIRSQFYDREQVRDRCRFLYRELNYPTAALVNPAQLAWGLRKACLELGVRLYEHSAVTKLVEENSHVIASTPHGQVRASRLALGTNAFPPLLKRLKHYIVPVYDYALVTEPLTPAQRESIGWYRREGISDASRLFHYTRTTADGAPGAAMAIIGITDLAHIWKTITIHSHDWWNTSSRPFLSWKGSALPMPGVERSIRVRASVYFGGQHTAVERLMHWDIPVLVWVPHVLAHVLFWISLMIAKRNVRN
jgi:hypothetical protein